MQVWIKFVLKSSGVENFSHVDPDQENFDLIRPIWS